jgi:hypothetical protein
LRGPADTGMRVFLIQLIAVVVGQFIACGDIPVGHNPNGAGRDLYRAIRVARMVDVPGFIAEELPVDIPAGVERKNVDIASGKAFRAFFFGNLLPPCTE